MRCERCGGAGVFYTRVINNHPIKAKPDDGMCYRCHGSGIDPYLINKLDIIDAVDINNIYTKSELIDLVMAKYNKSRSAVCRVLNNMYKNHELVIEGDNVSFPLRD